MVDSKRTTERKPIILVIDDEPQICRLMERCLQEHFDKVIATTDPIRAHAILEKQPVTHILSDLFFGSSADGFAFLRLWKRKFPQIERAVIFTASDIKAVRQSKRLPCEIDDIVSKADGIVAIIQALLGESL